MQYIDLLALTRFTQYQFSSGLFNVYMLLHNFVSASFNNFFCYMIFQLESVIIVIPGSLFLTFMEPLSHPTGYPSVMTLKQAVFFE